MAIVAKSLAGISLYIPFTIVFTKKFKRAWRWQPDPKITFISQQFEFLQKLLPMLKKVMSSILVHTGHADWNVRGILISSARWDLGVS